MDAPHLFHVRARLGTRRPLRFSVAAGGVFDPVTVLKLGVNAKRALLDVPTSALPALRDAVLQEIITQTTADGVTDHVNARKRFYALGDAGRVLFGDQYEQTKKALDSSSKRQADAATKRRIPGKI